MALREKIQKGCVENKHYQIQEMAVATSPRNPPPVSNNFFDSDVSMYPKTDRRLTKGSSNVCKKKASLKKFPKSALIDPLLNSFPR